MLSSVSLLVVLLISTSASALNYKDALSKSILFFESQRSGYIDRKTMRVKWRGNSGLRDGAAEKVNLVGGYYDAGDHIKFGLPQSFSMTMLSWGIIEYGNEMKSAGQLSYARSALRWGINYILKCHTSSKEFWAQVGEPFNDHGCWQRPEDMDTSRAAYKISTSKPGTEVVAEAAAALAAASIVFRYDAKYSKTLLSHSKQLFEFGNSHRGNYSNSIPNVKFFYNSFSGYTDELAWASAWLYRATKQSKYFNYIIQNDKFLRASFVNMKEFSWDTKFTGVQMLMANVLFQGNYNKRDNNIARILSIHKRSADYFACSNIPGNPLHSTKKTKEGLLYVRGVNSQYVMSAALLVSIYADYLSFSKRTLKCGSASIPPSRMLAFSRRQVNYLLGENRNKMSYMVGFGSKYPKQVHHRGASMPSIFKSPGRISCGEGFSWFYRSGPNPNLIVGAIVGGPDKNDYFADKRDLYKSSEPTLCANSPAVGILAKLSAGGKLKGKTNRRSLLNGNTDTLCQITIHQTQLSKKPTSKGTISSYDVMLKFHGEGNITQLIMKAENFHPIMYWNVSETVKLEEFSLTNLDPPLSNSNSVVRFGYKQFGEMSNFQILFYSGPDLLFVD